MNAPRPAEPRVEIIEGQRTLVVERRPPLPSSLQLLLSGGRDEAGTVWRPIRILQSNRVHLTGARMACLAQDHRLVGWLDGFHIGSDRVTRHLRLSVCADCGSVCVRDASFDSLDRLPTSGQPLRRKDHVIAWYSGARPSQRTYGRNLS